MQDGENVKDVERWRLQLMSCRCKAVCTKAKWNERQTIYNDEVCESRVGSVDIRDDVDDDGECRKIGKSRGECLNFVFVCA